MTSERRFGIDYLAWTFPFETDHSDNALQQQAAVITEFLSQVGNLLPPIAAGHGWELEKGRGFYQWRVRHQDTEIALSWGHTNAHVYVECAGQACIYINAGGNIKDLCEAVRTRASRVDFAIDFKCDYSPADFIVNNDRSSFKAGGTVFSEDGETCYVGSWKSERFARVYRYHKPHPRHEYLRAEAVYKGDAAKLALAVVASDGVESACYASHAPFQWVHPVWLEQDAPVSKIPARLYRHEKSQTVAWLYGTVLESVSKAAKTKVIDLHDWLTKLADLLEE